MVTVALPRGMDVAASFARFARSGDDLLERWDGRVLARCCRHEGRVIPFAAELSPAGLRVTTAERSDEAAAVAAARTMVEPVPPGWAELLAEDPALAALDVRHRGLHAVRMLDAFVALVHSISAQQVNLRWAATTRRRLAESYGDEVRIGPAAVRVIDVGRLAAADVAELRSLQLTTAKASALIGLAAAVDSRALDLDRLASYDDAEVMATLVQLRGVGPWTAEWYLARVLGRSVVVAGDLAVRKAVGILYGEPQPPSPARTLELTAHWGAAALHAQQLVLHALGEGTLRPMTATRGVPS